MRVRTTMPILVPFVEFPTFSNHKITHNVSFSKCLVGDMSQSTAKLQHFAVHVNKPAKNTVQPYRATVSEYMKIRKN